MRLATAARLTGSLRLVEWKPGPEADKIKSQIN